MGARQLTLDEKKQVQLHVVQNPQIKNWALQEWIASKFGVRVGRSTVRRYRNAGPTAFDGPPGRIKKRRVKFPELENEVLDFFRMHEGKATLTDDVLLEEARRIRDRMLIPGSSLTLSNGWLYKFKRRHNIKPQTLHGESSSVDQPSFALPQNELKDLLLEFEARNVFNFDESALFYRLEPNKILASSKVKGKKGTKDRITVALCCNLSGTEKMTPLIVSTAKEPRCFRGGATKNLLFDYYSNKNALMTRLIFTDWLHQFDQKMHGRKVLLLVDNASSHDVPSSCKNVTVKVLPPNMISCIQPLDAGIMRAYKARYRRQYVRWLLDALQAHLDVKLSLLEAVRYTVSSWSEVPQSVIVNCWKRCGIVPSKMEATLNQDADYDKPLSADEVNELSSWISALGCTMGVDEYIDVDRFEPVHDDDEKASDNEDTSEVQCISPATAMEYCVKLRQILIRECDDEGLRHIDRVAQTVRRLCAEKK